MFETIGRNEPCPCGSGTKYKKCCGANVAVPITRVIEGEIDELQKRIIYFALDHFEDDIYEEFEGYLDNFHIEGEDEQQFYELVYTIWYSLFFGLEDGETILEKFIRSEAGKIKRPKLKKILQSWTEPRAIAGEIIGFENNILTVVDGLSSEKIEAIVVNMKESFKKDTFFIGFLLPYEQNYVFFPAPFDLTDLPIDQAIEFIKKTSRKTGSSSPQEFLTDFFMEVMYDLPSVGGMVDIEGMEWQSPIYQEVAEIFEKTLKTAGESGPTVDIGVILWYQFCQKKQKRIKNPNLYAAALHYLLSTFTHLETPSTQKEIAKLYGVPVGSLSPIYGEMDDTLEEEINHVIETSFEVDREEASRLQAVTSNQHGPSESERMMKEIVDEIQGLGIQSMAEINDYLNKRINVPFTAKVEDIRGEQKARSLIYDAMETQGPERYKLAKQALEMDPNCVDAYVILAEFASTLEEALTLSEKGMKAGEKELGKSFIKKNKGHFWGLIETRPYMRAKATYATSLYQLGKMTEAIKQYEEILELNPNDNQGVRYELFAAYMDKGLFEKAEKLLKEYEEGSAHELYNMVLLELLKNGFSEKAAKLLKAAKKENKHVVGFISGKKRLPKQLPDYYGWGDENEAIIYADAHLHLWKGINGLQEWLTKH